MTSDRITDYITNRPIDNVGSEVSRQTFERFLVETAGYARTDILVDVPLTVQFQGQDYHSAIDLVIRMQGLFVMAITCVAGSIGSYEREILAGARLLCPDYQIPFAVTTDARDAVILDTRTGRTAGKGLSAILTRQAMTGQFPSLNFDRLDPSRREREMIIYRSFNLEKVNRCVLPHHQA